MLSTPLVITATTSTIRASTSVANVSECTSSGLVGDDEDFDVD